MNMRSIVQSIILTTVLVVVVVFISPMVDLFRDQLFVSSYRETGKWQTYTSQTFGFQIDLPSDWTIVEFPNDAVAPRVNMYPRGAQIIQPLTLHSDRAHVSVFPQGVPTESFFGKTIPSDIAFSQDVRVANDFILTDGSRFATLANVNGTEKNWTEAGFVWSRVAVERIRVLCFRGEKRMSEARCDPSAGDTVVHEGKIDPREREIHKKILSSFKFTDK